MALAAPISKFVRRLSLVALLGVSAGSGAWAQPAQPPAPPGAPVQPDPSSPAPAIVLRAELASRYLAVDALFARLVSGENPPPPERIAALNRQFDDITSLFFSGRMSEAVRVLHDLERELSPRDPMPKTVGTGLSLRVEPRVWWAGAKEPRLTLRSFAPAQVSTTGKLAITAISRGAPTTLFDQEFAVEAGKVVLVETPLPDAIWPRGESVRLVATLDGVSESAEAMFSVVDASLDTLRESLLKRLDAITPRESASDDAALAGQAKDDPTSGPAADKKPTVTARAVEIARHRLAALTDAPSDTDSAQFLADPPALARELTAEVEAIEAGRNPYGRRLGEYQRPQGKERTPCMIYAPKAAADATLLPLVIALHGMGGDESMFIRGYGGGLLCRLADDKNFVVAAPLTYKLAGNAAFIDSLIEDVAADYAIDRDRVYVIGHSLGGGVTMYLAQARASTIAAAACIAGAGPIGKKVTPCPTLVVGAELDRIGGPTRVRPFIQAAIADAKPVEYREVKNYGHTLVVGRVLPEVIEWMFQHTLSNRPPREPREETPRKPELRPADVKSNDVKTNDAKKSDIAPVDATPSDTKSSPQPLRAPRP
ncbi:MAG: alpha/beta fold hydrolase [Phycisphaerales bacterium]|jgi:predicted esterase|nr:alpha/beta fold hydrolase [Phycisphaerales bacterium]